MAQAAAHLTPIAFAANDNHGPGPRGDLWRQVIDRIKEIDVPFAVFAAQERLRGMDVHDFCDVIRRCIERDRLNGMTYMEGRA